MNRKEFGGYAKKYGIAVLCAIPVLIALDIWLLPKFGNVWIIVFDCVLILLAFALTLFFSKLWSEHITKKRTEFLNKKEAEKRKQLVEQAQEREPEQKSEKIWQKQKKNYPQHKRKK